MATKKVIQQARHNLGCAGPTVDYMTLADFDNHPPFHLHLYMLLSITPSLPALLTLV
jgi:hypothetical protein